MKHSKADLQTSKFSLPFAWITGSATEPQSFMNVGPMNRKADALSIDPAAKQSRKVQVLASPDQHSKKGDSPKGALGVFHLALCFSC
jgi:hypothetical protein